MLKLSLFALLAIQFPSLALAKPTRLEICRDTIAAKVCPASGYRTDQPTDEPNTYRDCESDQYLSVYQAAVLQAYDLAPAYWQSMVCGLDKIYIERDSNFRYDAWSFWANNKDYIGFRASMILKQINLQTNITSYDQQFFKGGKKDEIQADLPSVVMAADHPMNNIGGTLVPLAGHEMGHLMIYRNPELLKAFSKLGWTEGKDQLGKPTFAITDEAMYDLNSRMCLFSMCKQEEKSERADASNLYLTLKDSYFVSFFSTVNPEEDFCETMYSTVLADTLSELPYALRNEHQGEVIDMLNRVKNPSGILAQKVQFVRDVIRTIKLN